MKKLVLAFLMLLADKRNHLSPSSTIFARDGRRYWVRIMFSHSHHGMEDSRLIPLLKANCQRIARASGILTFFFALVVPVYAVNPRENFDSYTPNTSISGGSGGAGWNGNWDWHGGGTPIRVDTAPAGGQGGVALGSNAPDGGPGNGFRVFPASHVGTFHFSFYLGNLSGYTLVQLNLGVAAGSFFNSSTWWCIRWYVLSSNFVRFSFWVYNCRCLAYD